MDWVPTLSEWQGPLFLRVVDALAADIAQRPAGPRAAAADPSGAGVGARSRPHHGHARIWRGAAARTFGSAGRAGHFRVGDDGARNARSPRVGQHRSFDEPAAAAGRGQPRSAHRAGAGAIRADAGFSAFLSYSRPGGSDDEREVAANWLRPRCRRRTRAHRDLPGSQAIIFDALLALTSPATSW